MKVNPGLSLGGVLVILSSVVGACTAPLESTPLPAEPVRTHGTPSQLTLIATLGTGTQGGHATLVLRVLDAFSAPVNNVTVSLAPSIGTVEPAAVTTDENGRGTATLSAPTGSVKVTATIANGPTTSTLVAMQPPAVEPNPTPNPPPPNTTPGSLSVQLSATTAQLGTSTSFTLLLSGGAAVQAVDWTFGDGATFAGISTGTAHTYAAIGSYAASVTVTDREGNRASASTTATVTAAPPPPPPPAPPSPAYSVSLTAAPSTVIVLSTSTLTANVTMINGAPTPTSFTWDCDGNGTPEATTATTTNVCTYGTVGTFTAKVTATGGTVTGSATTTVTVTVAPPPTLTATLTSSASTVAVGSTLSFTATVGGFLTGELVTAYQWDLDATAGFESTTTGNTRTSAAYTTGGLFTAQVKVTTSAGRTVTATTNYVVTN